MTKGNVAVDCEPCYAEVYLSSLLCDAPASGLQ